MGDIDTVEVGNRAQNKQSKYEAPANATLSALSHCRLRRREESAGMPLFREFGFIRATNNNAISHAACDFKTFTNSWAMIFLPPAAA